MSTADARTVLLARPGEARDRLRAALEQAGVEVVLQADPLEAGPEEVAATGARNLVIAVDAEVEDALERFDPLLADARYRILFEESGVVNARDGWDVARWSRHLGAKLLGHGDVLPFGHEEDGDVVAGEAAIDAAPRSAAPTDVDVVDDVAGNPDASSSIAPEAPVETASTIESDAVHPDTGEAPAEAARADAQLAFTRDEVEDASEPIDLDDVALGVTPDMESGNGAGWSLEKAVIGQDDGVAGEPVTELPEPPTDAALDWARFQDFEAVNELPAANAPQAAEADYRAALAQLEESDLSHDDAYQQMQEEVARFDREAPADRWQDFERPTVGAEDAPVNNAPVAPVAPPDWSLTDEPLSLTPDEPVAGMDLEHFEARIASMSIVAEHVAGEGAIVLVGGIGGPDPLRQILQQLKPGLGVPVLVQQWLDGGQYDRLVRQMDRATELPVELATPGQPLQSAHVYIVPIAVGIARGADGAMQFTEADTRGFADLLAALPAASSGVFLLSGAGEEFVEPALRFQQSGGRIYAQAAEGCYDHAVPALLISRGAEAHLPAGLATQLAARWQQQDSE